MVTVKEIKKATNSKDEEFYGLIVQSGAVFNVDCKMGVVDSKNNGSIESLKSTKKVVQSTTHQQAVGAK